MSANDRQEFGDHYQSRLQHWDLIERHGIGYLEACATKYVTRWRKKNGLQDLIKARHYLEKLMELHVEINRHPRGVVPRAASRDFAVANGLDMLEDAVVHRLCSWACQEDLERAMESLDALIRQAEAESAPR